MLPPDRPPVRCSRQPLRSGLTLVEVLIALAVVCLVVVLLWPANHRTRILSKRLVCASNLSLISKATKIYEHRVDAPLAAPDPQHWTGKIRYTTPVGGGRGTPESPDRSQPHRLGPGGATEISPTRFLWMLVRSGDIITKQFVCPTSGDTPNPTADIELYYDFAGYQHISFGYQVPFGPGLPHGYAGLDTHMGMAADKGPYTDATIPIPPRSMSADTPPADWAPYNSRNHGGQGQNVLYLDGHVMFERTPLAGVERDNIYTVALDAEHSESRVAGESPWVRSAYPYTLFGDDGAALASADTVTFP
ncbi:MAG: prepilin-type N-terminal cleavage/methylation domain-containing protein [bacterium]|nr:prepilin-type N-terminal cleavage/methylation domain-containing protein [bacterium]